MSNTNEEDFIDTAEAARLLNVSRRTLQRWIKSGDIKARRLGRDYTIRRKDLKRRADKRKRER